MSWLWLAPLALLAFVCGAAAAWVSPWSAVLGDVLMGLPFLALVGWFVRRHLHTPKGGCPRESHA